MRQRVLSSHSHNSLSVATLDSNLVERVYARCASVYDWLCGPILQAGRREAMYELRRQPGNQILEIGSAPDLRFRFIPTTTQLPVLMCPSGCCERRHGTSTAGTTSNCSEWTRHDSRFRTSHSTSSTRPM